MDTPETTPAALPEITDELLDALEFRYAEPRVCRVCGWPLQLADTKGMKFTCTNPAASPLKNVHEAAGATWKQALNHYQDSTMYDPPRGDVRVLVLVAEVRKLRTHHRVTEVTVTHELPESLRAEAAERSCGDPECDLPEHQLGPGQ